MTMAQLRLLIEAEAPPQRSVEEGTVLDLLAFGSGKFAGG